MARLLDSLRGAGAEEQAAALADRAAAHVPLDDPGAVAGLLDSLREAGAEQQAAALLARDPPPTSPSTTRAPWPGCWTACGRRARSEQAAALLARDPAAHVPLDDPVAVAGLLDSLREAGAEQQAAALAARPPPTSPSTTRSPWPGCWTACGRRARRSRPPRWPTGCRGQGCSSSSASTRTARIGFGSAGRLMAAPPGHGDGKIWTDAAGLSNT